jgi:hypothetical protein
MISLRDALANFHYRVANLFLRLHRDEAAANAYRFCGAQVMPPFII